MARLARAPGGGSRGLALAASLLAAATTTAKDQLEKQIQPRDTMTKLTTPHIENTEVHADYFGAPGHERFQWLVFDGQSDDPAVAVRLNPDGSVAEIAVRHDLRDRVTTDKDDSPWMKARDGL